MRRSRDEAFIKIQENQAEGGCEAERSDSRFGGETKMENEIADTQQDHANDNKQHMQQKLDAVPDEVHCDQHPGDHKKTNPSWEKDTILQVGQRQDMIILPDGKPVVEARQWLEILWLIGNFCS